MKSPFWIPCICEVLTLSYFTLHTNVLIWTDAGGSVDISGGVPGSCVLEQRMEQKYTFSKEAESVYLKKTEKKDTFQREEESWRQERKVSSSRAPAMQRVGLLC